MQSHLHLFPKPPIFKNLLRFSKTSDFENSYAELKNLLDMDLDTDSDGSYSADSDDEIERLYNYEAEKLMNERFLLLPFLPRSIGTITA